MRNKYYLEIPKSNHRHCHTSQASHGLWHAPHFILLQFHIPTLKITRHLDYTTHLWLTELYSVNIPPYYNYYNARNTAFFKAQFDVC